MKRTNVAIIGAGTWGEIHAMAYSSTEAANLVCICDLDEMRAKTMAEKYHCNYTTKSSEIANDSEIEVVSVATPDFAHFAPVMEMLEANKNIIVEKPLATSLKEAEEMTKKAKEKHEQEKKFRGLTTKETSMI